MTRVLPVNTPDKAFDSFHVKESLMKIEKISNSQIRCILTGEDLASRQLRLSELAYGTEKARALFRDMMEQAAAQCGFDA